MKLLIADDDIAVHRQIDLILERNQLELDSVLSALDGHSAFELFCNETPDIIITDMNMPHVDGLTFMQRVRELQTDCRMIVLSGYSDFTLTRQAFLHGAVDYLLKPVTEVDLVHLLTRIIRELQDNQPGMPMNENVLAVSQEEFLSDIAAGTAMDENELLVRAEQLHIHLPEYGYLLAVCKLQRVGQVVRERFGGNRSLFYRQARSLLAERLSGGTFHVFRQFYQKNEYIICADLVDCSQEDAVAQIHRALRHLMDELNIRLIAGVCAAQNSIESFSTAYLQAVSAMGGARIGADGYLARSGELPVRSSDPGWGALLSLVDSIVEAGDAYRIQDVCGRIGELFTDTALAAVPLVDLQRHISGLLSRLEQHYATVLPDRGNESVNGMLARCTQRIEHRDILGLGENLIGLVVEMSSCFEGSMNSADMMQEARRYIEQNYQSVTLQQLAQRFFLNKNYFSTLFKAVMDQTFSDYLTEVRMKKACDLLQHTRLKTYEVANLVGYDDARYFSQVFKKALGMQPTEYRKLHRQQEHNKAHRLQP